MPLIRRLPKRGFNNAAFKQEYAIVNLDDLNNFKAGATINEGILRESKHIRGQVAGLKILGRGELKHGLTIEADRVSQSAREKIEKAGGTITLRERKPAINGRREEAPKAKEKAPAPAATKAKAKAKKPAPKKKKSTK
jgi:large subunit ribosomal protein L15